VKREGPKLRYEGNFELVHAPSTEGVTHREGRSRRLAEMPDTLSIPTILVEGRWERGTTAAIRYSRIREGWEGRRCACWKPWSARRRLPSRQSKWRLPTIPERLGGFLQRCDCRTGSTMLHTLRVVRAQPGNTHSTTPARNVAHSALVNILNVVQVGALVTGEKDGKVPRGLPPRCAQRL
jgi:hypothetical protein